MNGEYLDYLATKHVAATMRGLDQLPELNSAMFPHQRDTVEFMLSAGRGAPLLDTGLGKSLVELEYGRVIAEHTGKPVLMLAPLAVGPQHVKEAKRFGIDECRHVRTPDEVGGGINITNYERLHLFSPELFGGIVLDESSILKSFTGKTTASLMAFASPIHFRLAATATPAPNDYMELGQHAQFLGTMNSNEMLARWFTADQSEMGRYRLKKHGIKPFWSWVASWARMAGRPSDLGHSDDGFILPPLNTHIHEVRVNIAEDTDGQLFRSPNTSATEIHKEKRRTADNRAAAIAEIVNADSGEQWVVWVETDYEADAVMPLIPGAVEVRGSMSPEIKEQRLVDFGEGRIRVIVTKPRIAGFGLNWQQCARTAFVGLSFSYEQYYQAIRRFWRFGQKRQVEVHIAMAETEGVIWHTIKRKAADHENMKRQMFDAMRRESVESQVKRPYQPTQRATMPAFLKA